MKRILGYISKYWWAYLIALVCLVAAVALDMLTPQITKRIIDDVIVGEQEQLIGGLLLVIFFIGLGRMVFQYFKELTFDVVSTRIGVKVRRTLFKHIQGLSMNYFDKTNTGELMARLKDDVDLIWSGTNYIAMLMIEIVVHVVFVVYCMISASPLLSIIPLVTMPLLAVLALYMERKLDKVFGEISDETTKLNTVAEENLAGVRTVKSFAREKHEIEKFLAHNERYRELNMQQAMILIKLNPYFQFIGKILPITTVMIGGTLVMKGEITLGTLGMFIIYCDYIVWPMEVLGWIFNEFASALASVKKIEKIYNEHATVSDPEKPIVLDSVKGRVTFDDVSLYISQSTAENSPEMKEYTNQLEQGTLTQKAFDKKKAELFATATMTERKILEGISFDLLPGHTLGIMGATGSGKTSIINLLSRFCDTTSGTVMLDGVDTKQLTLAQLRGSIAQVMQDVFLFSDSIAENVRMGKRTLVNDTEIVDSLQKSLAMEFVEKMDEGTETIIGERGVGLSGGQKQRISIARALAKKAPVLVLDDSTSALDMETELAFQKVLGTLSGVSKIIVAHRISAVRHADEIIFIEDGKIAERGNHETLLAKKGLYFDTYMAQYGAFLEEGK